MILDSNLCFDPAGSALTTTRASTNIIDLVNARDIGIGHEGVPLNIFVLPTTDFTTGTSAQVQFQGAPDNGSGLPGTYVTYAETPAIVLADWILGGFAFPVTVPRAPRTIDALTTTRPRFLRLNYVVVGTMAVGTLQAYMLLNRDDVVYYPSGFSTQYV